MPKPPPEALDYFKKLPPEALDYFKKQGKKGGKTAAAAMTPEQRTARAKKAAAASAKVRAKKVPTKSTKRA